MLLKDRTKLALIIVCGIVLILFFLAPVRTTSYKIACPSSQSSSVSITWQFSFGCQLLGIGANHLVIKGPNFDNSNTQGLDLNCPSHLFDAQFAQLAC
jgi:hypothetical protein